MKNTFYLLYIVLIFGTCSSSDPHVIDIVSLKDTVNIGELFIAEVHVPSYNNKLPKVHIISRGDTLPIPYDQNLGYAVFKSAGKSEGIRSYNGFVDYYNKEGKLNRELFVIQYYIKDE